ncbi:UDP-N-acetylglucosamine 4,6-dehydratase [Dissulfuribacter thermophilus]|uniref:UDP-N-acetylglucosamine 4,6-dehydratase n=1 Tax=Dissulfuribacter thermophilus TaxID=1156395 RepID=A0A1B9F4I5_9BACT|nr:UDP-N-acetylglucosamine 4,6-dehydratase [Dissulfuribacter thermophilus]
MIDFSLWGAIAIRLGSPWPPMLNEYSWLFLLLPVLCFPAFMVIGLYSAVVRYASLDTIWAIFKATFVASLILCGLVLFRGWGGFPRTVPLLFFTLALPLLCSTRLLIRYCYCSVCRPKSNSAKKVVIYGAGSSGAQISTAFNLSNEFVPVAFIDDNPTLHGRQLNGIKIFNPNKLPELLRKHSPEMVLLAMPSASKSRVKEILNWLEPFPVEVKRLPFLDKLVSNKVGIGDIQDVAIEDLLGRDPIPPRFDLLRSCISGKSVMVTGAGGSIGSELCRQIVRLEPKRLILFERSEYALYHIDRELQNKYKGKVEIIPILGSVCREQRVEKVLSVFDVNTIYHAAAYKHVPLVEYNPIEGIRNNVFGTMKTALAALNCNVETFVLISTDKAVRPTNIMGASKRMAELVLQGLAADGNGTKFTMVRFGNVLNSSGSVVPLFRQQILKGGPVTVTHPEITRYFMTIPEAVELVLQASAMGEGGEVFVLDMGEPVKILDLAKKMIRLSGFTVRDEDNPDGDIEIVFTGLRPGEKLYEELLISDNAVATEHPMIKKAEEKYYPWPELKRQLDSLEKACSNFELEAVRNLMFEIIDGYKPQCDFVDPVWLASNKKH